MSKGSTKSSELACSVNISTCIIIYIHSHCWYCANCCVFSKRLNLFYRQGDFLSTHKYWRQPWHAMLASGCNCNYKFWLLAWMSLLVTYWKDLTTLICILSLILVSDESNSPLPPSCACFHIKTWAGYRWAC